MGRRERVLYPLLQTEDNLVRFGLYSDSKAASLTSNGHGACVWARLVGFARARF